MKDYLFKTSLIGSLPRSKDVLTAKRKLVSGMINESEFNSIAEKQTTDVILMQEKLGLDIICSGEIFRDNYVSFIYNKIDGVVQMSMADMLDYVDDKREFENILTTLDVPAVSIKNAICNGKIRYKHPIVLDELRLLKKYTTKPVKVTLPGPYLVTRSMWLPALSRQFYKSKEALGLDVIKVFKEEIDYLLDIGVDVIQFDEPVLTEIVFTEGKPRTFMCAALSSRKDTTE